MTDHPVPERRDGQSKLHGRPLDENGTIELTVERPLSRFAIYEAALQSIAGSSCCGACQEAKLVAQAALNRVSLSTDAPAPDARVQEEEETP